MTRLARKEYPGTLGLEVGMGLEEVVLNKIPWSSLNSYAEFLEGHLSCGGVVN